MAPLLISCPSIPPNCLTGGNNLIGSHVAYQSQSGGPDLQWGQTHPKSLSK